VLGGIEIPDRAHCVPIPREADRITAPWSSHRTALGHEDASVRVTTPVGTDHWHPFDDPRQTKEQLHRVEPVDQSYDCSAARVAWHGARRAAATSRDCGNPAASRRPVEGDIRSVVCVSQHGGLAALTATVPGLVGLGPDLPASVPD